MANNTPNILATNVTLASNAVVPLPSIGLEVGGADDLDTRLDRIEAALGAFDAEVANVKNDTTAERQSYADDRATFDAERGEMRSTVQTVEDRIAGLERRMNETPNFDPDAFGARVSKVEADTAALLARNDSNVINAPSGNLEGFTGGTTNFPNGFIAQILEQYFSGDLRRYRQEVDAENLRRAQEEAANQPVDGANATR